MTEQQPAGETEGSASGQRPAEARRGCAGAWPRPSMAAPGLGWPRCTQQQLSSARTALPAAAASAVARARGVSAPTRAWRGGRGAVGILGGDAGGAAGEGTTVARKFSGSHGRARHGAGS